MNILVTGSNGQVGQELQALAANYPNFHFIFANRATLDIGDLAAVSRFFDANSIDYCINCAAYTAVDKAEEEQARAELVNVQGAANLANACATQSAVLIQLSTDYVYHNAQNTPFKEDDLTNPQSIYACTKLAGEQAAQTANPATMIVRTSWVYSSFGHNFVKTMLRLGRKLDHLRIVFDQIGTPTYARDLADCLLTIIQKVEAGTIEKSALAGIFHYSNEGVTSWYDFAVAIFELEAIEIKTTPIESKDYPTPAKRPPFSVLNKEKIRTSFEVKIPHWRSSLQDCLDAIRQVTVE